MIESFRTLCALIWSRSCKINASIHVTYVNVYKITFNSPVCMTSWRTNALCFGKGFLQYLHSNQPSVFSDRCLLYRPRLVLLCSFNEALEKISYAIRNTIMQRFYDVHTWLFCALPGERPNPFATKQPNHTACKTWFLVVFRPSREHHVRVASTGSKKNHPSD